MLTSGRLLLQMTLNALDSGLKDAVSDLMTKTLQKMAALPELSSDDIDDTVLIWYLDHLTPSDDDLTPI